MYNIVFFIIIKKLYNSKRFQCYYGILPDFKCHKLQFILTISMILNVILLPIMYILKHHESHGCTSIFINKSFKYIHMYKLCMTLSV